MHFQSRVSPGVPISNRASSVGRGLLVGADNAPSMKANLSDYGIVATWDQSELRIGPIGVVDGITPDACSMLLFLAQTDTKVLWTCTLRAADDRRVSAQPTESSPSLDGTLRIEPPYFRMKDGRADGRLVS